MSSVDLGRTLGADKCAQSDAAGVGGVLPQAAGGPGAGDAGTSADWRRRGGRRQLAPFSGRRAIAALVVAATCAPGAVCALPGGLLGAPASALAKTSAQTRPDPLKGVLLTRARLGSGWTTSASPPRRVPPVACGALGLKLRGRAAHPAAAASPTFREHAGGPFVAQTAYLYDKASQAERVWHGIVRPAQLKCMDRSIVGASTRSVRFTVVSGRRLAAPRVGVPSAAYQVTAIASSDGQSDNAYLGVVLLRSGRAITELSFSSFLAPVTRLERRLAHQVAARLRVSTGSP